MSDKTELSDGQVATLQHEVVQELRNIDLSVSAMESRLCNMEAAIANGFNKITISEGIHLAVKQLLADSTAREYVVQILDRAIKQVVQRLQTGEGLPTHVPAHVNRPLQLPPAEVTGARVADLATLHQGIQGA